MKNGEHGEQILEALCATKINLIYLNISKNKSWWTREDCRQLLQAFLCEQERLEELEMYSSYLTSEFSENLLTTIAQTPKLCS